MDLFGQVAQRDPFKDIGNQRESVAAEKARLCATLNDLLRRTPKASVIASAQQVISFKHHHKSALKVLQSKTSSRQELVSAINSIQSFYGEAA